MGRDAMDKTNKFVLVGCFFFFCFVGISLIPLKLCAELQKNETLAIGVATIIKGNLAQAKENAISEALMKGLENYLLRRLGSKAMVNNFQRVVYDIIPRARDKIENFNILAEDQIENEYKVLLRIRINEKLLEKGLTEAGVVVSEGPPLRALFLVSEWREGSAHYWWEDPEMHSSLSLTELALHKAFQKSGLSPINRTLSLPDTTGLSESLRYPDLDDPGALEWGKLFTADVVIYGKMELFEEKEAFLSEKILDVNQRTQISQSMESEQIVQGSRGKQATTKAIDRLVNRLAERLTPTIIRYAASDRARVHQLEVTLSDLSSYRQFRLFRDFLKRDVAGVKSVRQSRVRKNSISIAVDFQGDRNGFVERVLKHENLPFPIKLEQKEEEGIFFQVM